MRRSRAIAALGLLTVGVAAGIAVVGTHELPEAAPHRGMADPSARRATTPAVDATRRGARDEEAPAGDEGRRRGRSSTDRDGVRTGIDELEASELEASELGASELGASELEHALSASDSDSDADPDPDPDSDSAARRRMRRGRAPSAPGPSGTSRAPDAASLRDAGTGRGLIMYATDWCPVCTRARRWMTAQEIEFEERDVEEDPTAARRHAELNPRRTVPTFERGERTLIGFSPQALRGLLEGPQDR